MEGKLFATFFIPVGIVLVASSIASFAQIPLERRRASLQSRLARDAFDLDDLLDLSSGEEIKRLDLSQHDQCVTRNEFTLFLLYSLGKIDEEDLQSCRALFSELDLT